MIEVYYRTPPDSRREDAITEIVHRIGGALTFREEPEASNVPSVCLTYEFSEAGAAAEAATSLERLGEHVEGPQAYGA